MNFLHGFSGPIAVAIACFLLYIEEAGVPLPVAPGEAVLIASGLLIASGRMPVWLFLPAACGSVLAGALTGYAWAHHVGMPVLLRLAHRVRATKPFQGASRRLRGAGAVQIAASRLVPGLRVYTSLLAGAVGVDIRRFVEGASLAVVPWVIVFTVIGIVVGVPAEHIYGRFQSYAIRAGVVLVVVAGGVIAVRHIPPAAEETARERGKSVIWRLPLALLTDLITVAAMVVGLDALTTLAFRIEVSGVLETTAVFAAFGLIYLVAVRRSVGSTGGEVLLNVSYWAGVRRHPPAEG